jgi:hypothetical protein
MDCAKLLGRETCPGDQRGAYCTATRSGADTRRRMRPVYQARIAVLFARHVTAAEARVLADVGRRLVKRIAEECISTLSVAARA